MKVVLPDGNELELADGASGLDAARAIGPRLAEQAVLIRADGEPQDLRAAARRRRRDPDPDDRDTADPDALAVLRHSSAHLLAEAVRTAAPGCEGRDRPADRERLLLRLRVPRADLRRPTSRQSRPRCAASSPRGARGRARRSHATTPARASTREGEPYKVELVETAEGDISLYTQGDFTDLCRGPHLQTSAPIKAFKLTGLAGAYWRGDEKNTQLTRIYGTAFFSQADLDAHLERLEQARARDHRRLGAQLDLFHFDPHSPGSPLWHPKGMVIYNLLEDVRRRENARRGYLEVKTPLLYDKTLWITSGHWEKFRDNMFLIPGDDDDQTYGIKPMNCPGHMLLFGSQLRSYRDLPMRYAEAAPLHRNELTGTLHGLTRVRFVTQDDAHIFCTEEQVADRGRRRHRLRRGTSTGCSAWSRTPSSRPGPTTSSAPTSSGMSPRTRCGEALERHGMQYVVGEGEGAFYGPKIDLFLQRRARTGLAARDDPVRHADAGALRADVHGRRQRRAHADRRAPGALRLVRALHRDPDRALRAARSPSGCRPSRRASCRSARATGRPPTRCVRAWPTPATASTSTTATRRWAGRIRDAELEKIPYVLVWGDRESDDAIAVRQRGDDQSTRSLDGAPRRLRVGERRRRVRAATIAVLQSRDEPVPHLPGHAPRGFNRVDSASREDEETGPLLAAVSSFKREGGQLGLVICL